jgi:protein-S-isoprenylcysteine O-methyltransferase Ste14
VSLETAEWLIGVLGVLAVLPTAVAVALGLRQSLRRPQRQASGLTHRILSAPIYLFGSAFYIIACYLLWQGIPFQPTVEMRAAMLMSGSLLYFPGLMLLIWARLTLGGMYNVSSGFGVQLYEDQRLITSGPFALVRHPMYIGWFMAALGGILIYRTWTPVFLLGNFPGLAWRARLEDRALAEEFGEEWEAYRRRVRAGLSRYWCKMVLNNLLPYKSTNGPHRREDHEPPEGRQTQGIRATAQ